MHYQLLPDQLVKIERGEWPFMGGRLILRETVLNFAKPTAKRLTFEVVGLDAKTFVDTPRLQGNRRDRDVQRRAADDLRRKRRADRRRAAGFAAAGRDFVLCRRGQQIEPRNDGEHRLRSAEGAALSFDDRAPRRRPRRRVRDAPDDRPLGLGGSSGPAKILRGAFRKVPFQFNITIKGPFRSLIQTAKSYRDPRQQIGDVLPRPLDDIPGITTEVRRVDEEKQQTQTPRPEQVNVAPPPPPSER